MARWGRLPAHRLLCVPDVGRGESARRPVVGRRARFRFGIARRLLTALLRSAPVVLMVVSACDPGDVVLLAPESNSGVPALTVHAVVDTPYAALATALGWTSGVPGARVRVHLMTEPYDSSYWHVAIADGRGVALFPGLLAGLYEVEATYHLAPAEVAETHTSVVAGGGRRYAPGAFDIAVVPDRRGSLVFSEFALAVPTLLSETGGISYSDAMYFEIYNNSDTTIYLDGKYWGMGFQLVRDQPYWPCAQTVQVRNDPGGIWAERIFRFPGTGTDHPLDPGHAALIAKVAIDHRPVNPGFDDLRQANFEWGGIADNPDVPNLQDIGLRPMVPNWPAVADMPEFLSEPVDLATLPRYTDPYSGHTWVRIPAGAILDTWAGVGDQSVYTSTYAACLEVTNRAFDQLPGPAARFRDFYTGVSAQRRVFLLLPDGRKVLQDTNLSMFDFVAAPRTPGWIP